jgi:hypothetical protein
MPAAQASFGREKEPTESGSPLRDALRSSPSCAWHSQRGYPSKRKDDLVDRHTDARGVPQILMRDEHNLIRRVVAALRPDSHEALSFLSLAVAPAILNGHCSRRH